MPPAAAPQMPETFRCERQRATLSVPGCLRMWRAAQAERPQPWQSQFHCLTCPIGAAHAGQKPEEAAHKRAEEAVRLVCPRCLRLSNRLINQSVCVSCYNRNREVARGRNCKGNLPVVVMARIHTVALAVAAGPGGGAAVAVETTANVMGRAEAMMLHVNRALRSGKPFSPPRFGSVNRAWAPVPHRFAADNDAAADTTEAA